MHPAHRHRVVRDDEVARLGGAHHGIEQVAEPFDIGIVQRRVHFVEHANGGRIGEEQRKDQRGCRQRLLSAGQQRERLQTFTGRLRKNLKPGF